MASLDTLSVASLFCGAGGLDTGFSEAGCKTVYSADIDEAARSTFRLNTGVEPSASDLRHIDAMQLSGSDVIIAGPPCQGFSSFRKRGGNDPRNGLFVRTAEIISAVKPAFFVIENVSGILSHAGGRFASWAMRLIEGAGLVVEAIQIECVYFGVPQRRKRVIFLGGSQRFAGKAITAFRERCSIQHRSPPLSVGTALHGLPLTGSSAVANHVPKHHSPAWYPVVIQRIGPGQKLCDTRLAGTSVHSWDIPSVFGRVSPQEVAVLECLARLRRQSSGRRYAHLGDGKPVTLCQLQSATGEESGALRLLLHDLGEKGYIKLTSGRYVDLTRKFNGRFKRLDPGEPAPAVTRDFGSPRTVLHPTENRGLTVRECARLQGFSDSFVFSGSVTKQYQLVANAVPPPVSRVLAACIEAALKGVS